MNEDKINPVISVLCSSIQSERVFLEFAKILGQMNTGVAGSFLEDKVQTQSQMTADLGFT